MSRMNQVMQIGDIEGDVHYYIEDYAYTYLKKQKGKEKTKYYLYGEKEENDQTKKIYIYGIAEKPKMEQTYFKEYYPLGFLKIKNDETFWVTLKGQEQKVTGFYVFYAPNQAMQEYLVDHREVGKTDKPEDKAKRQLVGETLPMQETLIPARKIKKPKSRKEFRNEKFIFPISGILAACLILLVLTSANGRKKIEIFRQVIAETMSGVTEEVSGEDLVIEEKSVLHDETDVENELSQAGNEGNQEESVGANDINQESITGEEQQDDSMDKQNVEQENGKEDSSEATSSDKITESTADEDETTVPDTEEGYEEYVVKDGDTLVGICKTKYGSLAKMEEICTINNIQNADYIAPGQKLYLP